MRKKFSRKMKTEFTQQWAKEIPSMGIYKNMWLMNIVGPVVVGVLLEVKSGNDMYYPTVHLYNLADYIDEEPTNYIEFVKAKIYVS